MQDEALVFEDQSLSAAPATHVFIVGVGRYDFGQDKNESLIAGDLAQLSSPPESARAIADWFLTEFDNSDRPLGSLSFCLSEEAAQGYMPPGSNNAIALPEANLASIKKAAGHWAGRLQSHVDNMSVFYFCGHGVSLGQKAALLLSDFGDLANGYDGAIEFDKLRGTLKNAAADQQLFLLDCCRTKADGLYRNESDIGSRILSIPPGSRGTGEAARQCVLFPTIEGEMAYGQKKRPSVFATSFLDAVRFAAPDDQTGPWIATTSLILNAVYRLIEYRLPAEMRKKTVPNALEATNFEFNQIDPPTSTKSFITLSDPSVWLTAELDCLAINGGGPTQSKRADQSDEMACCVFDLAPGEWEFSATLDLQPPHAAPARRTLARPVTYVRLDVQP